MPLEPIPPPFPYGKILTKDIHHCNSLIPCTIHLSDIGKHYHAFSKGTFWIRYIPPAIPQSILHSLAVSPHIDDLQNHSSKTIAMSDLNVVCKVHHKHKPLTTSQSLGYVVWPSGCGDMAIPNQQYHCNSFVPFTSTSGISFKLHDIQSCLVIQTKIHMQILCLSLK